MSDRSHTFIFRDYVDGEVNSTRIYDDVFPNELSEKYNLNNYLRTVYNDNGDEDPSNDLMLQAPALEELLTLTHTTDDVPAIFDRRITINSPAVIDNILETSVTISIPDSRSDLDKVSATLNVIEVIPDDGKVVIDSNPRTRLDKVYVEGGRYFHYSSAQNGVYDQIFVLDEDNNVLAICIDYDYNFIVEPNKRIFTEKHIIDTEAYEGGDFSWMITDARVYLGDYKRYDGLSLDPTLSDSLYDIWKIAYTSSSSQLMKEVQAITSSQFVQSVQSRIIADIAWQVASQLVAYAVSVVLNSWLGPVAGFLGYALVYGLLNAWKTAVETAENAQYIRSYTLHNEDYEGEITLSSKKAYSELWGGTLPNIVGFSTAGVYSEIHLEIDKHLFKGSVILAPEGIQKTDWFGLRNIPISLNYAMQKGSYIIYSDFDDPRLTSYFALPTDLASLSSIMTVENTIKIFSDVVNLDPDVRYMGNTILYLENTISKQTDGEYDTIYPYMIYGQGTFIPTLQFGGLNSKYPVPEFYHDYPIFVDDEYYSQVENQYSTIYKVIDNESSQDIELIPEDAFHSINAEIPMIEVTFKDTLGAEQELSPYTYEEGHYSYDSITGIVTLSDTIYDSLQFVLDLHKKNHESVQDYDAYYILEVKIGKYRSLDDLRGMTQEEVDHIALMQGIEQSILEYTYQFKHAQDTQQGLSEMFYTTLITVISTIITTGITLGVGAYASKFSSITRAAGMDGIKATDLAVRSFTQRCIDGLASGISSASMLSVILSPITESLQEIFVDPFLETIVTDIVAKAGGNVFWQVLISSLVEGFREALTGGMSDLILGTEQTNTQTAVSENHQNQDIKTEQENIENIIEGRDSQTQTPSKWRSFIKTGASLILGTALIGIGGPMFFGASLACGFSALQSISKTFKHQKAVVKDIVQQSVDSETADIIYDLMPPEAQEELRAITNGMQETIDSEDIGAIAKTKRKIAKPFLIKTWNWFKEEAKEHKRGIAVLGSLIVLGVVASVLPVLAGIFSFAPITIGMVNPKVVTVNTIGEVSPDEIMAMISSPVTRLEGIKRWQSWRLQYEPSKLAKHIKSQVITTTKFLDSIGKEITKITPGLTFRNLRQGIISDIKKEQILGTAERRIRQIRGYIKKKGFFKIALDELVSWKSKLLSLNNEKISYAKAVNLIDAYIIQNKPVIPISRVTESIYKFHPYFKEDYFKKIDTLEKAYWLGFFFGDGTIMKSYSGYAGWGKRIRIGFALQSSDSLQVIHFCGALGLNPNYIFTSAQHDKKRGVTTYLDKIYFQNEEMAQDLYDWGFVGSKDPEGLGPGNWPAKEWSVSDPGLAKAMDLTFALGLYDAEGDQASTTITSSAINLLQSIKEKFNLPYRIRPRLEHGTFRLSLGGSITNLMQSLIKNSLLRKRKVWGVAGADDALSNFKALMTKDLLDFILKRMSPHQLSELSNVDYKSLDYIMKDLGVYPMSGSYYERLNGLPRFLGASLFGDYFFIFNGYYEPELIKELSKESIVVDEPELLAIIRNIKGKIIWLDQGTKTRGFDHIIYKHTNDFSEYFGIYNSRSIGEFILDAIKNRQIHREYDGDSPGAKSYVYRYGSNYLKMIVDDEGEIITAFPSKTDYF